VKSFVKIFLVTIITKEICLLHSILDLSELDTKIGRLFMAGMPGTRVDSGTEALIRDYGLGGVILFGRNVHDPVQLAMLCNDLQGMAMKYHGIPLLLSIDQEGGPVARLKEPFTSFPGNSAIGLDPRPMDKAMEFARITAREMSLVGLNMDLAPVIDVRRGEPEKHLEGRIFSDSPEEVALLGRKVIEVLQENGVMAVAKHFPGLGKTSLDPHRHLPTIDADAVEMEEINIPPFESAITARVSAVMTSHAIYPVLDPGVPATLSHRIITGLLRDSLNFSGLIMTDDLDMGAISKQWGVAKGAAASFEAGADILLICGDQDGVLEGIEILRGKLIRGEIPFKRFRESLDRIKKTKTRFLKDLKRISLEEVKNYFDLY
jgi:beta-N-acetylhexosaminidase